ncbi:MAG: CDGSH iron-sulfur domain-containing protein [Pseudomonadota bacterium]
MADPACPQKVPYVLELDAADYWWCACGLSKKQPFCDGTHKGGPFTPVKFTVAKTEKLALCACKRTQTPPFCDGTHKSL